MIEASDIFKSDESNLFDIFNTGKKFLVPDYQRKYAWTKNQLDQLWEDFKKTHESCYDNNMNLKNISEQRPHFLGAIVLTILENENYEIIDGQQRLTTICIFMKVLLEISERITDANEKYIIMRMAEPFLQSNIPGMPFESKITLDDTIDEFFKEYILLTKDKKEKDKYLNSKIIRKNSSKMLIKESYEFIYEKLKEEFPESMTPSEVYQKLYTYIIVIARYFLVLKIGVKKKNTAYTIFETLNKRGKDLSESDMIKNALFKVIGNTNSDIKLKWDTICENIDTEDLTEYIRFSYVSKVNNVTPAQLYEEVRKLIKNNNEARDYLEDLESESELYGHIVNINSNYWSKFRIGGDIINNLNAIKDMDIKNCTPLILSGAIRFIKNENNIEEFSKLLSNITTFCFRYFTIGGNSVSNFDKEIGNMSRAIRGIDKEIKKEDGSKIIINNLSDLTQYMKSLTVDTIFKRNFKQFSTKSMQLAFYIIYSLEKTLRTGVVPLTHGPKQHVEHIMPKKPSKAKNRINEWSHVRNKDEYSEYIHRLGNLMILESEINESIKNKDFKDKLEGYKESGLYYPDDIVKNYAQSQWDFSTIESRQEVMSNAALNVWNYK